MSKRFDRRSFLVFSFFFLAAFIYRIHGLFENLPFWVDEFSSANQARLILQYGAGIFHNPNIVFDAYHAAPHFLIAFFYRLFGQSEFITRLPTVIIGSFIPALLFLLGFRLFNMSTGLIAGLLATTSYFEITWSRQARGYILLQLSILAALFLYFKIIQNKKRSLLDGALFIIFLIIGMMTHSFFYIFILFLGLHFLLLHRNSWKEWIRKPGFYIIFLGVFLTSYFSNFLPSIIRVYSEGGIIKANNFWYYHSFLWREYSLITFLFFIGLLLAFFEKRKAFVFVFIYLLLHIAFITFFFEPFVSRYLLPLWPLILLIAGFALANLADIFSKKTHIPTVTISLALAFIIIINGHKFTIKPKSFYSVNHDFREIALIDYHQVYNIIKTRGELEKGKTAVIDTWPDRLYWYMGRDFNGAYIFRWVNETGKINGLARKTYFYKNNQGDKVLPRTNNLVLVGELADLKKVMTKFPKGFIFIDDTTMPGDVIEYVQKNFKKELFLDHFPLDDNPYSIWPATLYSWGI